MTTFSLTATLYQAPYNLCLELCLCQQQGSLADELLTADKGQIIGTLRDQEEENRRLRCYLDGLLMIIMEHDPQLLEVA